MPVKPKQPKRVTIDDVARLVGVSKTTISRYLNGKYDSLSDDTRVRVRAAIEQLDYRPNRVAQRLKTKSSRIIGCLVSDIGSPFSSIVVKGINSVCTEAGYQLLLVDSGDNPVRERKGIQDLMENQVDGLIVNTTGQNDRFLISLKEQGVHVVLADRALQKPGMLDTVVTDNYRSAYDCVCFLYELGYRKIAFFTHGSLNVSPRILRYEGYRDALLEKFQRNGEELIFQFSPENGEDCSRKLLRFQELYPNERRAVFAINGVTMLCVLQGIQATGIIPGANFGVCGFDNWGWADLIPPGITTISQNSWLVGRTAAELLLKRINGNGPKKVVYKELKNKLEIRGSTVNC